jgi:hypothetical protein
MQILSPRTLCAFAARLLFFFDSSFVLNLQTRDCPLGRIEDFESQG